MSNALTQQDPNGLIDINAFNNMLSDTGVDLFDSPYQAPPLEGSYLKLVQDQTQRDPSIPAGAYMVQQGQEGATWSQAVRVLVIDIIGSGRDPYDAENPAPRVVFDYDPYTGKKGNGSIKCKSADGITPLPEYHGQTLVDFRTRNEQPINAQTRCKDCIIGQFQKDGSGKIRGPICNAAPIVVLYVLDWDTPDGKGMVVQWQVNGRAKQSIFGDRWYAKYGKPLTYWTGTEAVALRNGQTMNVPRWMRVNPDNPEQVAAYPIWMASTRVSEAGSYFLPKFMVIDQPGSLPDAYKHLDRPLTQDELAGYVEARKTYAEDQTRDQIRRVGKFSPAQPQAVQPQVPQQPQQQVQQQAPQQAPQQVPQQQQPQAQQVPQQPQQPQGGDSFFGTVAQEPAQPQPQQQTPQQVPEAAVPVADNAPLSTDDVLEGDFEDSSAVLPWD